MAKTEGAGDAGPDPVPAPPPPAPWIPDGRPQHIATAAFSCGAALAALHPWVAGRDGGPRIPLRERLAVAAAAACLGRDGRPEGIREVRDALAFTRPGDDPGPAGRAGALWLGLVRTDLARRGWRRRVAAPLPESARDAVEAAAAAAERAGRADPVARAAEALQAAIGAGPLPAGAAALLADAELSRALGWPRSVPLLAVGLRPGDMHREGESLRLACLAAVASAAGMASRDAAALSRRAAVLERALRTVRTRGRVAAAGLLLREDAVAPARVARAIRSGPGRRDRAARRLCERLEGLGAVRELTGRRSFRLYGL